jgi:hypothetical protein
VWLLSFGAAFMFVGALGNMLVKVYEARAEPPRSHDTTTHTKESGRRKIRQAT